MASSAAQWRTTTERVAPGRWAFVVWALAGTAAISVLAVTATLGATEYRIPVLALIGFATLQAAAIPGSLLAPTWATASAVAGAAGLTLFADPTTTAAWPVAVTTMIACALTWVGVAFRAPWSVAGTGWLLTMSAAVIPVSIAGRTVAAGALTADLVVFGAVTAIGAVTGVLLRHLSGARTELTRQRALTAEELARREAVEDRARIARELHDVVAHGMSAIQVRAASARYRFTDLPPDAAAEFDELAATARASMTEMRAILGVLRDEDTSAARAPQPGWGEIGALVTRARELGPVQESGRWDLTATERADPVFGLAVYRAVQEALSNIARHAPGAPARITWLDTARTWRVTIANDAPARPAPPRSDGGHGLRGMTERISALGGTVTALPTETGFAVQVDLPRSV